MAPDDQANSSPRTPSRETQGRETSNESVGSFLTAPEDKANTIINVEREDQSPDQHSPRRGVSACGSEPPSDLEDDNDGNSSHLEANSQSSEHQSVHPEDDERPLSEFVPKFEEISAKERKLRSIRGHDNLLTPAIPAHREGKTADLPVAYPLSKMVEKRTDSRDGFTRKGFHDHTSNLWEGELSTSAHSRKVAEQCSHAFDSSSVISPTVSSCTTLMGYEVSSYLGDTSTTSLLQDPDEDADRRERRRTEANFSDLFGRVTPKAENITAKLKIPSPSEDAIAGLSARERYLHQMGSHIRSEWRDRTSKPSPSPSTPPCEAQSDYEKACVNLLREAHSQGHRQARLVHNHVRAGFTLCALNTSSVSCFRNLPKHRNEVTCGRWF
eukprot:GHVN01058658.1.p3 GENE.GHVN01058658.1~~GHVN01058658.1.p3  ORF type:complete len:384 (+),score=36.79 GHVN01058658.1:2901-4052(+)